MEDKIKIMKINELPTFENCDKKMDSNSVLTALEIFIWYNEPEPPHDSTDFRKQLIDLINEKTLPSWMEHVNYNKEKKMNEPIRIITEFNSFVKLQCLSFSCIHNSELFCNLKNIELSVWEGQDTPCCSSYSPLYPKEEKKVEVNKGIFRKIHNEKAYEDIESLCETCKLFINKCTEEEGYEWMQIKDKIFNCEAYIKKEK